MTNSSALITVEGAEMPMQYINRNLVIDMGESLMGIHPSAKEIGVVGMRTVAQLALITGANPLPGTNGIHAWLDSKKKLCFQFGIGYWRGEIEKLGGVLWVTKPRPMSDDERALYSIQDDRLAAICEAALSKDVGALMSKMKGFGIDLSLSDAKKEVSRVGISEAKTGAWQDKDGGKNYKEAKSGRPLQWTANERAERDLFRKLAPVMNRVDSGQYYDGGKDWNVREFVKIEDKHAESIIDGETGEIISESIVKTNPIDDDTKTAIFEELEESQDIVIEEAQEMANRAQFYEFKDLDFTKEEKAAMLESNGVTKFSDLTYKQAAALLPQETTDA